MSANPVNAWDMLLLAASETSFGTTPTPASTAAYAGLALETVSVDLGPTQQGQTRPKQDRNVGRGMQSGFVEGRVQPIPFTVVTSVKSRSAGDGVPLELALYRAAGLGYADTGSDYTLSPNATPVESSVFAGVSLTRFLGSGAAAFQAETLRGGVVKSLKWEGGDKEVMLTASGAGVGKYMRGSLDSVTFASGVDTTLTHTAAESYRLDPGYYLIESEIILISSVTKGGTSTTVTRAQLGTSGAAHSTKPLYPYRPSPTYTGSPIAEPNATCSVGGVTSRLLGWTFELTTGLDHLPGETGSAYVQGVKTTRYDAKYSLRLVLSGDQVSLMGKALARPVTAVSLAQGTGTGGVITIASSYCEVEPFVVPDTANDVAIIDVGLRVRDDTAGNNSFSIVLS